MRRALDLRVAIAQGREAERLVEPGVLLVADPDERQLEQPDDRGQHLLAGQARAAEVRVDPLADRSAGGRRRRTSGRTSTTSRCSRNARVIAVLLAPLRVAATSPGGGRCGSRSDPHVGPRGRDRERADARERRKGRGSASRRGCGRRTHARPAARDARPVVGRVAQARVARRPPRAPVVGTGAAAAGRPPPGSAMRVQMRRDRHGASTDLPLVPPLGGPRRCQRPGRVLRAPSSARPGRRSPVAAGPASCARQARRLAGAPPATSVPTCSARRGPGRAERHDSRRDAHDDGVIRRRAARRPQGVTRTWRGRRHARAGPGGPARARSWASSGRRAPARRRRSG